MSEVAWDNGECEAVEIKIPNPKHEIPNKF